MVVIKEISQKVSANSFMSDSLIRDSKKKNYNIEWPWILEWIFVWAQHENECSHLKMEKFIYS